MKNKINVNKTPEMGISKKFKNALTKHSQKVIFEALEREEKEDLLGGYEENCDVVDVNGNHCPEMPIHQINKNVFLCDKCYRNYKGESSNLNNKPTQ